MVIVVVLVVVLIVVMIMAVVMGRRYSRDKVSGNGYSSGKGK